MQWQEFRLTEHDKEDSFRMDTIIDVRSDGFGNIFPLFVRLRHTEVGHIKFWIHLGCGQLIQQQAPFE
jgi:hypothetical protein